MILLSMYVGVRSPQLPSCAQVAGPCFNDFLRHWLGGLLTRSRRLGRRNSPGWMIPRVRLPPHCARNGAHACLPRTQNRASGAVHRSGPPRVVTPAPAHHGDRPLRRLGSDFGVSHLPSRLERVHWRRRQALNSSPPEALLHSCGHPTDPAVGDVKLTG